MVHNYDTPASIVRRRRVGLSAMAPSSCLSGAKRCSTQGRQARAKEAPPTHTQRGCREKGREREGRGEQEMDQNGTWCGEHLVMAMRQTWGATENSWTVPPRWTTPWSWPETPWERRHRACKCRGYPALHCSARSLREQSVVDEVSGTAVGGGLSTTEMKWQGSRIGIQGNIGGGFHEWMGHVLSWSCKIHAHSLRIKHAWYVICNNCPYTDHEGNIHGITILLYTRVKL